MTHADYFHGLRYVFAAAALVLTLASGAAVGQTVRMGTETRIDTTTARQGALALNSPMCPSRSI